MRLKNLLLSGTTISRIASGILGAGASQSSEGDTPVESGAQPALEP
jgi:hypothetical protein